MADLTIGYVAGLISLGVFIVQVLYPTSLNFILAGVLRDKETAATWSVAGRSLQSSYWPEILRTDTARSHGVRKTVRFLNAGKLTLAILVTVASIVTPLGLYDALELSDTGTFPEFEYAIDPTTFGAATPPRSILSFNRYCLYDFGGSMLLGRLIPCPYSEGEAVVSYDGTTLTYDYPQGYNNTVPAVLHDIFSSGTRLANTTVSNFFDIQWRQYGFSTSDFNNKPDNGSEYLVGTYSAILSFIWDEGFHVVEGLVVDTTTGALGFRNHSIPKGQQYPYGAVWAEDLLFIEPETSCVDTNLTFEFTMASPGNDTDTYTTSIFSEYYLVDSGGFSGLNQTYPEYDHDNAQTDPDLQARAFKAAYLHNAYTMAYLNVTSVRPSWRYLNSTRGQKFPLPLDNTDDYIGPTVSDYEPTWLLSGPPGGTDSGMNVTYANPYNISVDNFQSIGVDCAGAGGADLANSSNIYVSCGLVRGPPRPIDAPSPLLFTSGSKWTSSLYSCASAVKASIKTVAFSLGGTNSSSSPDLSNLSVTAITPKTYPSPSTSSPPLWGIEDSGLELFQIKPIWGLLSSGYAHLPNVSTFQKPVLYLVGEPNVLFSLYFGAQIMSTSDNLPAADFPFIGLNTVYYHLDSILASGLPDYLGRSSLGSLAQWQRRCTDVEGAARMINAMWADITASAVVGTKGAHDFGDGVRIAVRPVVHRVKYRLAFAVPAFVVLAAVVAVLLAAAMMSVLPGPGPTGGRRSSLRVLRVNLKRTAVGRALALLTAESPEAGEGAFILGEREWGVRNGKREVEFYDAPEAVETQEQVTSEEVPRKGALAEQEEETLRPLTEPESQLEHLAPR